MDIHDPKQIAIMVFAFFSALTVHEYSHARAALAAGDDTAKLAGRLTLNPLAHLDPVGTIFFFIMMLSGFGIGWAKPVPINPMRFRNPRWDNLKVSLWGPLSNMIFAFVLSLILRFIIVPFHLEDYARLVFTCMEINVLLAVFNLIPIPPLDGSHILSSLLPQELARRFDYVIGRFGMQILIAVILLGSFTHISIIGKIIEPPTDFILRLLLWHVG